MKLEGGCYCGTLRYVAEGEPMMKAQFDNVTRPRRGQLRLNV
jgi:hypothetical protein